MDCISASFYIGSVFHGADDCEVFLSHFTSCVNFTFAALGSSSESFVNLERLKFLPFSSLLQTIRTSALWVSYLSFCTITPPWLNSVTTWSTVKNPSLIILLKWLGKLWNRETFFLNFNRSRVTLTSTQLLQRIHDITVCKQNVAHHSHTWDTPVWLQQEHLIPHRRNKESKILCCIVWFDEDLSEFGSQNSSHKFLDQALSDPKDTTHDLTQKTRILPKLSWASWTRRRTQA